MVPGVRDAMPTRTTPAGQPHNCCVKGVRYVETPGDDVLDGAVSVRYCDCRLGQARRYGLPDKMLDWTTHSYVAAGGKRAAVDAAAGWLEGDPTRWMILCGPYGTGKTGLAVCLYKAIVDRMIAQRGEYDALIRQPTRPAQFWRVPDLLDRQKAAFGSDVRMPLDKAASAEFLVLDDVGAERGTEFARDVVAQLIQQRYQQRRRTLLTTNLNQSEMRVAFGERVFDRLRDDALVIVIAGNSLRGRGEEVRV